MITVTFEVIETKPAELDIPIEVVRKYPLLYHAMVEVTKRTFLYTATPTSSCDLEGWIEYMKNHLKKIHNAYSVQVGENEIQLNEKNNDRSNRRA